MRPKGTLASAGSDGSLQIWSLSPDGTARTERSSPAHTGEIYALCCSPDGSRIATGGQDKMVWVWDSVTEEQMYAYSGHKGSVYALAWSPDGQYIASGGRDGTVQVWDATTGVQASVFSGHEGSVYAVAWSPGGEHLASGGRDKTMRVTDVTSGDVLFTIAQESHVYGLSWSPNGSRLAVASRGADVFQWQWDEEKRHCLLLGPLTSRADVVYNVAWSPDGTLLAAAGFDKVIQVWEVESGTMVGALQDHRAYIRSVAWSPDGQYLASASGDGTARIWQVSTGRSLALYDEHQGTVYGIAWCSYAPVEEVENGIRQDDARQGVFPPLYVEPSSLPPASPSLAPAKQHQAMEPVAGHPQGQLAPLGLPESPPQDNGKWLTWVLWGFLLSPFGMAAVATILFVLLVAVGLIVAEGRVLLSALLDLLRHLHRW